MRAPLRPRLDPKTLVFHYTSGAAFHSIMTTKQFWAHDYRLANDKREINYALALIRSELENVGSKKRFESIKDDIISIFGDPFDPFQLRGFDGYGFIVSFSEEGNQLSQWRAYAPDSGFALGFSRIELFDLAREQGFQVGKVVYDIEKQRKLIRSKLVPFLENQITRRRDLDGIDLDLIDHFAQFAWELSPLIKHESFHEEREWRIYRHLDSGDSIRFYPGNKTLGPFVPIELSISSQKIESLKEVIVGPSDDHSTLQRWTTDFLRGLGCDLRVMVSGSPYRLRP